MECAGIVLAAGAGTRMKSKKPKVLHEILGRPLVMWPVAALEEAGIDDITVVVGPEDTQVSNAVSEVANTAIQQEKLGTGDAVKAAMATDALASFQGSVVLAYGDCPLLTSDTIRRLVDTRESEGAACVVLTFRVEDPFGYGRIIREDTFDGGACEGQVVAIVEQKDANDEEASVTECNSGFYCFDAELLRECLAKITNDNAQGEYYITDAVALLRQVGKKVMALETDDAVECFGVNSRVQLAEATRAMQSRINRKHMEAGVTMLAPELVWIGPDVSIERDVTLLQNVTLLGNTSIGEDSVIGPDTRLTDTQVGRGCTVDETVAFEAVLDEGATAGPRAYLRPGAHLCAGAKAGTHVEIKKSTVGAGSKVPHLSYIGDAQIGEGVNIGAGSITCNYDGKNKHATTIGDGTFIGSDTMMVAPVSIGRDAVVGAGSVITKDVPDEALAVARARERMIDGWAPRHRK
ncbi:MAG: bifunctional UDP-N-acetylglucosamine diphosphorylase/glucosamine-1-phosphate N-acetyltransferase GlmU [Eggerthellaceae bacterium]|nr:bifunctional UDP-N-acetylglucosamine diphosphorylase/glucosamine-1-phosphate N-acetyltransferase GlmU [Eggerthellaceae bacterium]